MGKPRLYLLTYSLFALALFAVGIRSTATIDFPLGGPEDFPAFYTAGVILRQGTGRLLYDMPYQLQVQQAILQPYGLAANGGLLPYYYAPFFAAFFMPFSYLSLSHAFLVWYAINGVLLVASVLLIVRQNWRIRNNPLVLAVLLSFSFLFVVAAMWRGQSSLLLLFLLTSAYVALKRDQEALSGGLLALGLAKPQLILPLILVLLIKRRWRAVSAFAVVSLMLLAVSWLLVGDGLLAYPEALRVSSATDMPTVLPELMPNVRGTLFRLQEALAGSSVDLPNVGWQILSAVLSVALLAAILAVWRGPWRPASREFDLRLAATLGLTLLLAPHLHSHDLALLVLAGALLAFWFASTGRSTTGYLAIFAGHLLPLAAFLLLAPAVQAQFYTLLLIAFVLVTLRELRPQTALSAA